MHLGLRWPPIRRGMNDRFNQTTRARRPPGTRGGLPTTMETNATAAQAGGVRDNLKGQVVLASDLKNGSRQMKKPDLGGEGGKTHLLPERVGLHGRSVTKAGPPGVRLRGN